MVANSDIPAQLVALLHRNVAADVNMEVCRALLQISVNGASCMGGGGWRWVAVHGRCMGGAWVVHVWRWMVVHGSGCVHGWRRWRCMHGGWRCMVAW